jgi:diguanylate cyclase (GGDEF)-like protein
MGWQQFLGGCSMTLLASDETSRLLEVHRYDNIGAFSAAKLRRIAALAQSMFGVETVCLTTMHEAHQSCHVSIGGAISELARSDTVCQTTIEASRVLVVEDMLQDNRFAHLPIAVEGGQRFYAGAPLTSPRGHRLGVLCLLDPIPRPFSDAEHKILQDLADLAMEHMELLRLSEAAKTDDLTALWNRRYLVDQINGSLAADRLCAALLIDLDGFKDINDTLGHGHGDDALKEIARRLGRFNSPKSLVARLGGDEFVVFLDGRSDPLAAMAVAQDIVDELGKGMMIGGHLVHLGASVGVACRTTESDALQLLGSADLAMYQAKRDGRNRSRLFTREMRATVLERGNVVLELQEAWEDRAFELYYQPVVRLSDGAWIGAEALLRWNYPYQGVLSPAAFLPVLERSQLALTVGTWIIDEACRQAADWRSNIDRNFKIAVNLFELQFQPGNLLDVVQVALSKYDLPQTALQLEITEGILLAEDARTIEQIRELTALGVGISFDDFGTGFASLSSLKECPATCLKIDRSFVSQMAVNAKDRAIVDALIEVSRSFGLDVIAEGIETMEQCALLRQRSCATGQGFLFGRPMKAAEFEAQIKTSFDRDLIGASVIWGC